MNKSSNHEQHYDLSIVSALPTIHPHFELKHMAAYVLNCFWLVKSKS